MWLLEGFVNALSPLNLGVAFIGCILGTVVGILPGLGPTSAVALLFPITLMLPPVTGIIGIGAIFYGCMYGGSITSILLNIPGEISSVPACIEGFPLTKKGKAGPALVICAAVSFIGGIIALTGLAFWGPDLAEVGLFFGPHEYFALMVFSLACVAGLSGESIMRGVGIACLGLFIATIGSDPGTSLFRMTFGFTVLLRGFDVVPVVIGLFGIGEVLDSMGGEVKKIVKGKLGKMMPSRAEWALGLKSGLRGSMLGSVLGLIPGVTPSVGSFISYTLEKKFGKEGALMGTGVGTFEGIAGPEAANNAVAVAGFIPLMCLGIPTGPVMAIVLAALQIYGVVPGPMMFTTYQSLASTVIASFFIGNVILIILNIPLVGIWVRIAMIPYRILAPIILAICFWGAYVIRNAVFDIWVAVAFGILGYILKRYKLPAAPFVLGFILGDSLELYFRQVAGVGPIYAIFQRPISIALLVSAALVIAAFAFFRRKRGIASLE